MNFNDPKLVEKYGSWVKVQVAFYDYIFLYASRVCAHHFNEIMATANVHSFGDGEDLYEYTTKTLEEAFDTPEAAWKAFIENEKLKVQDI